MSAKVSMVALAVLAAVVAVQAAGGIKGQDSQQRASGLKGPALRPPPQAYLPPPPPPQPQPLPLPQRPIQQAIKGPGQVAPVFSAVRVQPVAPQPIVQQQQIIQQQEQEPEPAQQAQQIVQQQQQQEEIDPNAAAQDNAPAVLAPARAAAASEEEANPRPEPYAFQYAFDAADSASAGSSQREESQDANGRVTGFYTLRGDDGRDRRVDYVADASGFRATISTNEMGTAPKDSADVDWNAQAPSEAQLRAAESATQLARQRALANPQPLASSSSASSTSQKFSSPRQSSAAAASSPALSKTNNNNNNNNNNYNELSQQTQQLQEPFEQIRQVELNGRARKSRHAPFYLFTI